MTANDILKMIDAGFTREEILKLDAQDQVPDQEQAAADPVPEKKEPAPEEPAKPSGVTLSDDQFTKLLQQMNVQGASMDVPPEYDMTTKLADHFKEIMIGG